MNTRTISSIQTATTEMVGAYKVKRPLPTAGLKQVDPFIFIDHMGPAHVEPGSDIRIPPHPHAGFEVVTYLIDGAMFHRDSQGNEAVAKSGDVNWMTAGSGIIHSEGPAKEFVESGGKLQLLQVWINLPAKHKSVAPAFRHTASGDFPVVENDHSKVKVILGSYADKKSPLPTFTPMFYYHVHLKTGAAFSFPVEKEYTSAVYLMDGKLDIAGNIIETGQLVNFQLDGNSVTVSALADAEFMAFGGLPIKEKMVTYGPFVMNSFEEVQQAIHDYEHGKMGTLEY